MSLHLMLMGSWRIALSGDFLLNSAHTCLISLYLLGYEQDVDILVIQNICT
jgi:hypothetical protein